MSDPKVTTVVKVSGSLILGEVPVVIGCTDTALAFQEWCISYGYRAVAEEVLLQHVPSRTPYQEEVVRALSRAFASGVVR